MNEYTRSVGFDTIRLNWNMGSDVSVHRLPSEHEWYGDNPLPFPRVDDPQQVSMQLKCLEVEAFGGGKRDLKNGGLRLWRREHGVYYELRRGKYQNQLALETSLPKLLWGHNRSSVSPDMLSQALEELTLRGRSFIPCLPPCDELDVWRMDATADTALCSELELALVARVLNDFPLNGAMPTRYPTGGSLFWPASKGLPAARCYGKFAESGNDRAIGQYRSEVQCMGGKQFRAAVAAVMANGGISPEAVPSRGVHCLRAGTLASEKNVCPALLEGLTSILDSAITLVREVSAMQSWEAVELLEKKAGVKRSRAVQLLGYAHLVRVFGWSATGLNRKGAWEAKKDFAAAGVDPALIEFSSAEKLSAGAGMVVAGALFGAVAVAGTLVGEALADATSPKVKPAEVVEPEPVVVPDAAA